MYLSRILTLQLLISCVVELTYGTNEKYSGHQVVQLFAGTEGSAAWMRKLVKENSALRKIDVWAEGPSEYQLQVDKTVASELKKKCLRMNITMKVVIDDVKKEIDSELERNNQIDASEMMLKHHPRFRTKQKQRIAQNHKSFKYNMFNRFDDIQKELYKLQCEYPSIMEVTRVGRSYENRDLLLIKITNNVLNECSSGKKIIWIDGGTHAREWISVAAAMYMLKELVTKYGKDENITKLLTHNVVYIAPVVNPDGYEYTFTDDRLWRKSRTPNPGTDCVGTDLNRNWDAMWGGAGASNDPCDESFRGTGPESDPVVAAYAQVLRYIKKRLRMFWTLHSYSQLFLYPNSYSNIPPHDRPKMEVAAVAFYRAVLKQSGKSYVPGTTIERLKQTLTGVSIDYVHDSLNVTCSFLIELRPSLGAPKETGFLLSADDIIPTSQESFYGILSVVETVNELEAINGG